MKDFLAWVKNECKKLLNLANKESKMHLSSTSQFELREGRNTHKDENALYYVT